MKKYEIMFIVNPTLDEASINSVKEDVKNLLEKNEGKILDSKDMGQRDLAYEIKKHKKGYYHLYTIEGTTKTIDEFNHMSNVNNNIIRSLVVKIED